MDNQTNDTIADNAADNATEPMTFTLPRKEMQLVMGICGVGSGVLSSAEPMRIALLMRAVDVLAHNLTADERRHALDAMTTMIRKVLRTP